MKKILFIILAVMMLTVGTANADYIRGSSGDKLETIVQYGSGVISSTSIPAGTRILGFTIAGNGATAFAGLYDTSSLTTTTVALCIVEGSAASSQTETVAFFMPYKIVTGLTIVCNEATTAVTVYYE